jgi:hypothetical protein
MTREERRALLGDEAIAEIRRLVDAAPDPTPELVEELRLIMTRPGGTVPTTRPAPPAAAA